MGLDHVHLLVTLKATHTLSDFMREMKKADTLWMQGDGGWPGFSWQEGYCALTVSPSARGKVRAYIARQEEHHRKQTFHDELTTLLKKAGVAYDEQYLE